MTTDTAGLTCMQPKVLQDSPDCEHLWLDYEPGPCPTCTEIKAAEDKRGEEVLEMACVVQCDECRKGVKLVNNYQGYDDWLVHLNEQGGFSDDCSADEIRQAYKKRFGENG